MSPYGVTRPQWVKLGGAETGIFQESWDTTMAADALAPCVTRALIQYKDVLLV